MDAEHYADYRERQIQEEMTAPPAVIRFFRLEYHVEFEDLTGRDVETIEEGLKAAGAALGIARDLLYTIEIEPGLYEIYVRTQGWLGAIATLLESEVVVNP